MEIKKISSSKIMEILNRFYNNQIIDIKNYGSTVENVLQILENHPKINRLTKKEMSFWYDKIPELNLYREYLECEMELSKKKALLNEY